MERISKLFIATAVIGILLGGCATTSSQEQVALVKQQCPVLKRYSREQLAQAAKELRALATDSQIAEMITDYSQLRDACRVAAKKLRQIAPKQ